MGASAQEKRRSQEKAFLGDRILQEIRPVTELTSDRDVLTVYRDAHIALGWMETLDDLHRDITLSNIMYSRWYHDREFSRGMLSDRELAFDPQLGAGKRERSIPLTPSASEPASSKSSANTAGTTITNPRNIIGTLPYMSMDLLVQPTGNEKLGGKWKPLPHLFRYDQESLFWVMLIHWCLWKDGSAGKKVTRTHRRPGDISELFHLTLKEDKLRGLKEWFITRWDLPPVNENFERLVDVLLGVSVCFGAGYSERLKSHLTEGLGGGTRRDGGGGSGSKGNSKVKVKPKPLYDDKTLGGYVTFETIDRILNQSLDIFGESSFVS